MKIYNIESVVRQQVGVLFQGKEYLIKEPTVQVYSEIMAEIESKAQVPQVDSERWLLGKMCPELPTGDMLEAELDQIARIALGILRGNHQGKMATLSRKMLKTTG